MRVPRNLRFELAVAVFTLLVAGAFTQAAVTDRPTALFTRVERTAQELGKKIFLGKGNCFSCHGQNAKGGPLAPDLTDAQWLHSDGSLGAIENTIKTGVAQPKKHPAPMPPMGGARLNEQEVKALAEFVHAQAKGVKLP